MKKRALAELRVDWTEELDAQEARPIVDWTEGAKREESPMVLDWTEEPSGVKPRPELPWQAEREEPPPILSAPRPPPGWPEPSGLRMGELPLDLFEHPLGAAEEPSLRWRLDVELDRLRDERRSRLAGVRTVGWMLILFTALGAGRLLLEPPVRAEAAHWLSMGQLGQDSQAASVVRAKSLAADARRARP